MIISNEYIIYKPVPSPINKIKNKYRWRIIIKCKKFNSKMIDSINYALNETNKLKITDTRIIVDVNPNNMM